MSNLKIQILIDNPSSWIIPYAIELVKNLMSRGHSVKILHRHEEVTKGDILCLLSCEKVFKKLNLNRHNLVVHESDLPKGKGWSPITWQILDGKNEIPVTLFEAVEALDGGPVYLKEYIRLDGTELLPEIKHKQGIATQKLILDFVKGYPHNKSFEQNGESSYYPKRTTKDSEIDIKKSIDDQFNLLRVCDNDRYPAYFIKNGTKYVIKIEKRNA